MFNKFNLRVIKINKRRTLSVFDNYVYNPNPITTIFEEPASKVTFFIPVQLKNAFVFIVFNPNPLVFNTEKK